MNLKSLIFTTLTVIGLSSCTTYRYEYIAPATETGRTCVMQCMNTKNVCFSAVQAQTQNNLNMCQQNNHYSYQACVNRAQSHDEVKKCNPNPQYCPANPNYWQCDESYRQCFAACGGTVNVYENK